MLEHILEVLELLEFILITVLFGIWALALYFYLALEK